MIFSEVVFLKRFEQTLVRSFTLKLFLLSLLVQSLNMFGFLQDQSRISPEETCMVFNHTLSGKSKIIIASKDGTTIAFCRFLSP